jgi:predicted MFS family arabinose efflux permease
MTATLAQRATRSGTLAQRGTKSGTAAQRGTRSRTAGPARPPIFTRSLLLMFVADVGSLTSFFLLLSVVPLYAAGSGAGRAGAGLATGALTFATVAGELVTPRLVARFGYRAVFGAGSLLLGLPALALAGAPGIAVIVAVSVVRGVGFAFTVVAGSAVIASLIPAERRGEGLGLYGVGAGVPSVVALPLGVWLAGHVGYPAVFAAGAVAALAGFAALPALPGRRPAPGPAAARDPGHRDGVLAGLRTAGLVRPGVTFGVTAMAAGAVVTFVPLALVRGPGIVAPGALLAQPATATVARWLAGRHGDRHGPARLLVPGVAAATLGVLGVAVALAACPVAVIPAMALFGAGFGVVQNSSLVLMYRRAPAGGYGTVSAMWNVAYDAGLGLGGTGFGVLAAHGSYPAAFGLTAALMLAALLPAWRDRAG